MSQAEFKRRLKALMLRQENQVCSDCPERQPRWASLIVPPPGAPPGSLAMGAFCCLECSGSHRRLGVHISFVRSVNLDSWKEKEVLAMENGGNDKVNAIFEAHLSVSKPTNSASGSVRERFIRDKYERRKFYDPSAFDRVSQMEAAQERKEVVSGVQRRLANGGSRKPSDAARKRVEERAARGRSAGGAGGSARSVRAVKSPAPVPAPAPAPIVDLLDFGDFNSPEATSGVQASASFSGVGGATPTNDGAGAAASNHEPQLDLFANMEGATANDGQMQQQQQHPGQHQEAAEAVAPPEQKKMTNADILSMFSAPVAHHNPMQQNMFAMGHQGGMQNGMGNQGGMQNGMGNQGGMQNGMGNQGGMQNGMGGMSAGNMAMTNQMNLNQTNPQQMGMMNNNMQMMQMPNMVGQQQGMGNMGNANMMGGMGNMGMAGGQQGMGNVGGNMNRMQLPQMNNMVMMQGGGGLMMQGGGNQYSQAMGGQAQQTPQKQQQGGAQIDQFASFGNFGR